MIRKQVFQALVFIFLGILALCYYILFVPRHSPHYYYSIIKNQEKILPITSITEQDIKIMSDCLLPKKSRHINKSDSEDDCLRAFYKKYTILHGVEKAFSHLALVQREYPNMLRDCHYLSHGIGHGAVELNHGDVYKAFSIMDSSQYFKNVNTCGNGYYHGAVEEAAQGIKGKVELAKILRGVCNDRRILNSVSPVSFSNCFHGVGHAAGVAFSGKPKDALYVCDFVGESLDNRFLCYTGYFMETTTFLSIDVKKGIATFTECDQVSSPYKEACYLEQSSYMERFSNNPRNYTRNMGFCKQIHTELERMACVKVFAIRAVRIVRYEDVKSMCKNTSTAQEQSICSAIVAYRIAGSIDKTYNKSYVGIVKDICATFDLVTSLRCRYYALSHKRNLFVVTQDDLIRPKYKELLYSLVP
jgi:hypothetical protein